MSNQSPSYILTQEQRNLIAEELGNLKQENVRLQQSLREQQNQAAATTEDLFLDLLEVGDTLEVLVELLENNSNPSPELIQRLPRSLGAVYRKFLTVLAKQQVLPIEIKETQLDFDLCRVVDKEVRTDIPEQTITKVVRQRFCWSEKVLRPAEIIISKVN